MMNGGYNGDVGGDGEILDAHVSDATGSGCVGIGGVAMEVLGVWGGVCRVRVGWREAIGSSALPEAVGVGAGVVGGELGAAEESVGAALADERDVGAQRYRTGRLALQKGGVVRHGPPRDCGAARHERGHRE